VAIRGAVQGVGFRPFVYRLATELGLPGWVVNSAQGVFIEVDGPEAILRDFLARVEREKPAISFIQGLEASWLDSGGFTHFEIRESSGGEKTALVMPDLATCPDCLREVNDPADRRHRYPFTNCTNCGPRFTIIEALPYDRPRTTMKKFTMCPECDAEYHDPANRRFHAQPNACPKCGPHLELWEKTGAVIAERDEALKQACAAILEGRAVAVKGLGGFHLMCDARNEAAVQQLRRRKRREEKPFALMYPSFNNIARDCQISEIEARLLRSPESPIVLLRRREPTANALAESLAPQNPWLGVMLPYTPLHHLLMQELGFPVVATSGNLSDEPICTDEHEAVERLRGIADLFLVHDRPILRHVDDSILREMAGRELVLRRARSFAPLPITAMDGEPVLAVGAHQKDAVALAVGTQVFVSQHIGDLETEPSLRAFEEVVQSFERLYEITPKTIACDLHPDYSSTRAAERMVGQESGALAKVQHHYAHVLACMAENQISAPVLGVSWDGSGYGPDHTVWGGEFLRVTDAGYERVAHLRTFRLPGGEKAVKEPRRVALALLYEIFRNEAFTLDLPAVRAFTPAELNVLRPMLERGLHSPLTSSAGRLFDGVASLIGLRQVCRFEGQAAMELEFAADAVRHSSGADADAPLPAGEGAATTRPGKHSDQNFYPFDLDGESPIVIDWEPMIRAIVSDVSSTPANEIARKFHNTLARAIADIAARIGEPKVALTGGCFQNRYLTECAIRHILENGFHPYWHQRIPPNDGGIALGQVMAARRRKG
jgi:hydrogenase maturation protein HypF